MKLFRIIGLIFASTLVASVALADGGGAVSTLQFPAWIVVAIKSLENIPAIGHFLVAIIGVLAVATPILTALTGLLMAIEKAFNLTGLLPEINFLNQKLIPWIAMFSNLNVQSGAQVAVVSKAEDIGPQPSSNPTSNR